MELNDIYIHCVSNADSHLYPSNKLSKFGHHLSEKLSLPRTGFWYIALHVFGCHNLVKTDSNIIKIKCDQVEENENTQQFISVHTRRPYSLIDKVHFFVPEIYEWFQLNTDILEKFSFTLMNENDEQLQLAGGQPTYIVLVLRKMEQHQIVLRVSSRPTDIYPSNKPSNFRVSLPMEYSWFAQSPFKVAVSSITYSPHHIRQIKPTSDEESKIKLILVDENALKEIEYTTVYKTGKNFSCSEELITYVISHFDELIVAFPEEEDFQKFTIHHSSTDGLVRIAAPGLRPGRVIKIHLPVELAFQLGYRNAPLLGVYSEIQVSDKDLVAASEFILDENVWFPEALMIYTDFTKPTFVGIGKSSVVKIYPLKRDLALTQAYITEESKKLEFYDVEFSSLNNLRFELHKLNGDFLEFFEAAQPEVLITLMLLKK